MVQVDMGKEQGAAHAGDMSGAWGYVDEAQDVWAGLGGLWGGHPACGMGMACTGAWRGCRDEPGGHQVSGIGTFHAGV